MTAVQTQITSINNDMLLLKMMVCAKEDKTNTNYSLHSKSREDSQINSGNNSEKRLVLDTTEIGSHDKKNKNSIIRNDIHSMSASEYNETNDWVNH